MPYLNWKASPLTKRITPNSPDSGHVLDLEMGREAARELAAALSETFIEGRGELRLDLPDEWIMFWKWREGESRILLAHPQPDEWVATVALDSDHGRRFLESLEAAASSGASLRIGALGAVGSVSNVDVVIAVRG